MSSGNLVVFITGCSSGIGRALASEFAVCGHRVIATARKLEAIADLKADGMDTLALDVTSRTSIEFAVNEALSRAGRIDILINNAGFGLMGPLAELNMDDFRRQLETNVTGPLALVAAIAPRMAEQGGGRIVNVGSVSGVLPTPFSGAYCASKAALNSLTDVMRLELAPFGIHVISLQPGAIKSKFGDTASQSVKGVLAAGSLYTPVKEFIESRAMEGQKGAMPADEFARRSVRDIMKSKPPRVIRYGKNSTKMPIMKWLFPASVLDAVLSKRFGLNKM
jgi:NAD(P)-dependent dehydrogenase (short-subunit alcohol dehydrogenase family)